MSFEGIVAIVLAINLVCALASMFIAHRAGHDPFPWALTSAAIGPLGVIALLATKNQAKPADVLVNGGAAGGTLIPTDGSEPSLAAVSHFIATNRTGGRLTLLAVLPVERKNASPAELQSDIDGHVREAKQQLESAGMSCRVATAFGDPATEIVRFASEGGFDHILMGRRGRGGVAKMLLGSVSEKVTKEAPIPVTLAG